MSKQFVLNSFCIMLFGGFIGYKITHLVIEKTEGTAEMASVEESRPQYTLTKLASHQVYQDYFDVRIKHEVISKTSDGHSIVKAIISAKKDLPAGISYQWRLGQDVTSAAADIQGQLPEIREGEKVELSLMVYGFHKEAKTFLSLALSGNVDNHPFFKETLSSSRPEDSFEYVVQQKYEIEQQEKRSGKVSTKSIRSKKFDLENIVK